MESLGRDSTLGSCAGYGNPLDGLNPRDAKGSTGKSAMCTPFAYEMVVSEMMEYYAGAEVSWL